VEQFVDLPDDDALSQTVRPNWTAAEYMAKLEGILDLKELVKNPFLLALSLVVLPEVIGTKQDLSSIRVTRAILYDKFVDGWMNRGKERLFERHDQLPLDEQLALKNLRDGYLKRSADDFMKRLAKYFVEEQATNVTIDFLLHPDKDTWAAK